MLQHHRGTGLKLACYKLGEALQKRKYLAAWEDLRKINNDAGDWLSEIPLHMWTLYKDGGVRWGNATTNISESHNNSLKGTRYFPIRAIVESTLAKTVNIFQENWDDMRKCETFLPPYQYTKFMDARVRGQQHTVTAYGRVNGVYKVKTFNPRPGKGGNKHKVNYTEQTCTCNKWQTYRRPCSHAISVALHRQDDPASLVHEYHNKARWFVQFNADFNPTPDRCDWEEIPWSLKPDYRRLASHKGRGRKKMSRKKGSMDYQNIGGQNVPKCRRCGQMGHNIRNCPLSHPPQIESPGTRCTTLMESMMFRL